MSVPLHTILKSGYSLDPNLQRTELGKYNYVRDDELSDMNRQVYFHPEKGVLYNINGTSKPSDWLTNGQIALGITTNREKSEKNNIEKTRKKYPDQPVHITGSSLGGFLASKIAKPQDKITTFNKASLPFTPIRNNERHIRVGSDIVSLPTLGTKHTNTINSNPSYDIALMRNPFKKVLQDHSVNNLKNKNIYV
jgi:hypothetical protein